MDGSIKQQKEGGRCGGGSITVGLQGKRLMGVRVPEKLYCINRSKVSAQRQHDHLAHMGTTTATDRKLLIYV